MKISKTCNSPFLKINQFLRSNEILKLTISSDKEFVYSQMVQDLHLLRANKGMLMFAHYIYFFLFGAFTE